LIFATDVLPEDQDPPLTVEVKVVFPLIQIDCVPLSVPADGAAVTVTVRVAVTLEHPPLPFLVYVIVAIPAVEPPVTSPVEFTDAIAVLLLCHEKVPLPPLAVTLNWVVLVPPEVQIA
jgi:hypothetical protein